MTFTLDPYNESVMAHPSVMAKPSTKLIGTWVRHNRTGHVGYISYADMYRPHTGLPAKLWIIYPAKPVNPINAISAGSAYAKEVKVLRKRRPRRFAHRLTMQ